MGEDKSTAEIYSGAENPFFYSRTYSTKFECDFQLQSYPFDTQECTMELVVPSSQREFTDLWPKALIYTGVADLPQFSVTKVASKNINKTAVFVMTLKRKIAYHIISVYLPSATIFFISLVTMFVHIKHVEATIMVHLTAMLVMYTLFQAISISLPKTSYIKMIDIWLLFGLVLPFFAFTLSILEELVVQKMEDDNEKLSQGDQQSSHNQDRRISKISPLPRTVINKRSPRSAQAVIHLLGRRMLPIITAAFCSLYCLVAAFLYFFPSLQYGL